MKPRIVTEAQSVAWLSAPTPAVFQDLDLTSLDSRMAACDLEGCAFLGCSLGDASAKRAIDDGCVVMPPISGLPFDPFATSLYTPQELFDKYDPAIGKASYEACTDWLIYTSYMDEKKRIRPAPNDLALFRRIHDATVSDALNEYVGERGDSLVAIMGGHDRGREEPIFSQTAQLALDLTLKGYIVVTGGGPGLMEAGNLGAYVAAFADPITVLATAIQAMSAAPKFDHPDWMKTAFLAKQAMGEPPAGKGQSIGIPTWFYGHEPPNLFASHIAKYFENSVREEGLLAVAVGGIIFAEGNAGTVQDDLAPAFPDTAYSQCSAGFSS